MLNEIPLLFVTSFNNSLYKATGRRLLKTFIQHKIDAKFLITHEEKLDPPVLIPNDFKKSNFIYYNLEKNKFLKEWLEKYKFIIPKVYGGEAPDCVCPNIKSNWFDHKEGCCHSEWNRRASKWFRKIAALHYALELNPSKILFLDSDVYFTRTLATRVVNGIFADNGFIFHLGKYRAKINTGIESGVIGFSRKGGGFDFLRKVIECFNSGEFLKYKRWDDGYIFKMMFDKHKKEVKHRDLVGVERRTSHVVNLGIFRNFFVHEKGWHGKKYKVI